MGFFTRLFAGREELTPERFGRSLFDVALDRMRTLHAELDSMGVLARVPGVTTSKQYPVSLAIFSIAPLDQLLAETPSVTTKRARVALRRAFKDKFRIQTPDEDPVLDSLLGTYARTARAGDVLGLGQLAAEAMGLEGEAEAEVLFVTSYTVGLDSYSSVISEYERGTR